MRIVRDAPVQREPRLQCAAQVIQLPVESELMRQILRQSPLGYANRNSHQIATRLNLLQVGNAQILTIPGEALPNIGFYLKRKMRGQHNLLFGLTNDAFGYLLTKVDWNSFKRYDYVSRTALGETAGETFIDEALRLVERCPMVR